MDNIIGRILEANLEDLLQIRKELSLRVAGTDKGLFLYVECMVAFHKGEVLNLKILAHQIIEIPEWFDLKTLLKNRINILENMVNEKELGNLSNEYTSFNETWKKAEAAYVLGIGNHLTKNYKDSYRWFNQASKDLESIGAIKKSLRAEASALASYSCIYSESFLFAEHIVLYNHALRLGENLTAGVEAMNISREHQRLGALTSALVYAQKSVEALKVHPTCREEGLALVHRASVLSQMGMKAWAHQDLEQATLCQHKDVSEARKMLLSKINLTDNSAINLNNLIPTWLERFKDGKSTVELGTLEMKLLDLLTQGPQEKSTLLKELYTNVSSKAAETRLKGLINRARKKLPDLICFNESAYFLSDPLAGAFVTSFIKTLDAKN